MRNLRNNKTFSFLNILGFGIGIACASLIFLWVVALATVSFQAIKAAIANPIEALRTN